MDGEPWEQKKCQLDILYHGQVPMLTYPMTEMQEAMGVMADSLEWAKTSGLIDEPAVPADPVPVPGADA